MSTETQDVLAGMFTENTGTHFLDSGGAYGRNWERNGGRDTQSFIDAPQVTLDARFGYPEVTIDAFHYLEARLDYSPDMQRKLDMWAAFDTESPWLVTMQEFADAHERKYGKGDGDGVTNTYNYDNDLSQTLQYVVFTGPGDIQYMLLQVHGGADVRGGYTAPKAFTFSGYEGVYEFYDQDSYTLTCEYVPAELQTETLPGMPETPRYEQHYLDHRAGEWTDHTGDYSRDPWEDRGLESTYEDEDGNHHVRCPFCDVPRPMSVYVNQP